MKWATRQGSIFAQIVRREKRVFICYINFEMQWNGIDTHVNRNGISLKLSETDIFSIEATEKKDFGNILSFSYLDILQCCSG